MKNLVEFGGNPNFDLEMTSVSDRAHKWQCITWVKQQTLEQQAVREAATICPRPTVTLIFDLLTLKVVSESRVTWATSVPILVFLGLSVLDLGPMYATDRQTDRQTSNRQMSDSITA